MNKAYVFQHKFTGVQIFVYHQHSEILAKYEFKSLVTNPDSWQYIGEKTAETV